MGQTNSYGMGENCALQLVNEFPIGKVVKEQQSGNMHFLKEHSYNSQQTFQHAFIKFSRKLTQKHENIMSLQKTNTKVQNTFCSTFYKIVLVFQYIDHTLKDQIQMRNKQNRKFQEKQIWSILFHCTLALAHLRRTQSFQHSAIRPQDIRLSSQGVIKILPTQMVGINIDHDQNQATTKILAMTIISCIMMKHISNQSNQFLEAVIAKLPCSGQLKQLLNMMVTQKDSFQTVQEHLFKLAQDDGDSALSGVSTPVIRSHQKPIKDSRRIVDSFENVEIDIKMKQPDVGGLHPDCFDQNDRIIVFETFENQNPDQNDQGQSAQSHQNQQTPLTQKYVSQKFNIYSSNQKQTFQKLKEEKQTVRIMTNKKQNASEKTNNPIHQQKGSKQNDKQNIYTDPKLLDWIKNDFQQLREAKHRQTQQNKLLSLVSQSNGKKTQIVKQDRKDILNIQLQVNQTKLKNIPSKKQQEPTLRQLEAHKVSQASHLSQKKQLKITKQQECFGNILDEQASFKKSKSHKKSLKQQQISLCKRNLNGENTKIESQTKRLDAKKNDISESRNQQTERSNKSLANDSKQSYLPSFSKNQPSKYSKLELKNLPNMHQISSTKNQSSHISKPQYDKNNPELPKLEYVTQTYQKGKYQGQKLNELRHGHGTFLYNQGGRYVGDWRQNKMEGKGILYYPNNSVAYQGNWKNDQLHGFGTLFNEQVQELHGPFDYRDWTDVQDYWVRYEGMFNLDNKEGQGKMFLSNGQIFQGVFQKDMVNGQGTLSRRDGSRVKGVWRQNKLIRMY